MKWNKFRLKTTTEAEDIVSSMLADLGIEGVEIEDKIPLTESDKEQMFVDILPEIEPDDGVAYLSFYLEEEADTEAVLANVKKELEEMSAYVNVGECTIEESETEDVDWVRSCTCSSVKCSRPSTLPASACMSRSVQPGCDEMK